MSYEWVIHLTAFLILAGYRGRGAHYRAAVSIVAALLGGICFALTFMSLLLPPNPIATTVGVVLLLAVLRCRGNVAKLLPIKKTRATT